MMMEDYAAFCRQRLRACFHRRRKYPVGSDDRAHAVKEARAFLRYYRREMQIRDEERNQSLATTPSFFVVSLAGGFITRRRKTKKP